MENNNNLTQENRAFKKGDAYETLGIINTWIGNMDTKVSFALALAGVLIGVIFEKGMPSAFERITEVSTGRIIWRRNYCSHSGCTAIFIKLYFYFMFYVIYYCKSEKS